MKGFRNILSSISPQPQWRFKTVKKAIVISCDLTGATPLLLEKAREKFAQNVMCQHYSISYGDNTEIIKSLCDKLKIEII